MADGTDIHDRNYTAIPYKYEGCRREAESEITRDCMILAPAIYLGQEQESMRLDHEHEPS